MIYRRFWLLAFLALHGCSFVSYERDSMDMSLIRSVPIAPTDDCSGEGVQLVGIKNKFGIVSKVEHPDLYLEAGTYTFYYIDEYEISREGHESCGLFKGIVVYTDGGGASGAFSYAKTVEHTIRPANNYLFTIGGVLHAM